MKGLFRFVVLFAALVLTTISFAGTLTVTSPTNGAYLGTSNTLGFNISGAVVQVTVQASVKYPTGATTTFSQQFSPDSTGNIRNSLPLNFNSGVPQGQYTITVTATEPGATYNSTVLQVTVVPVPPQFQSFGPPNGAFVKGVVHIRAVLRDAFMKDWRVQINDQDIPNNTGAGTTIAVDWDTSTLIRDGEQTIKITATDLANNISSKSMTVTVTRVPPVITFIYPSSKSLIVPGSSISVVIDVQGEFANAVDKTGVDVVAQTLAGAYITRVSFVSFATATGTTSRWTGRILYHSGLLPHNFKLVATTVDKAGNSATPQSLSLKLGN